MVPCFVVPELLKSYKKQRVAIKRYFRYCSTSLLFFLGFSVFPFALRLSQKPFFVGARLCGMFQGRFVFVQAARQRILNEG